MDVAQRKMVINAQKYPVGQAKGSARKYDELCALGQADKSGPTHALACTN